QAVGCIPVCIEFERLRERRDVALGLLLAESAEITPGATAEVVARVDGKETQPLQLGLKASRQSGEIFRPRFQAKTTSQVAEFQLFSSPWVAESESFLARHRGASL